MKKPRHAFYHRKHNEHIGNDLQGSGVSAATHGQACSHVLKFATTTITITASRHPFLRAPAPYLPYVHCILPEPPLFKNSFNTGHNTPLTHAVLLAVALFTYRHLFATHGTPPSLH
jgi:hypothetical protein